MDDKKYNEDILHEAPNSILIGDGIPEGKKMTYRKGDIIINVGEKRETEPIYICVEGGAPGKWVFVQGMPALREAPIVEDTQVDTVEFNDNLSKLIKEFSQLKIQEEFLDVDLSNTYMSIATIDDPDYAEVEKEVSFNDVVLNKTSKLSIGNGNFVEFDQYIDNGNEMQLSLFTLAVAGDSDVSIAAEGYEDVNFKVLLTEPPVEV